MNLPRFEVKCQQLAIKRSFFSDTLCNTIMSLALEPIYKMFPVALQNVPCLHRHFGFVILSHKSKWQTYHRREWTAFKGEEGRFWSVNTFTFLIAVQRSCRLAANAFPTKCRLFFFFFLFCEIWIIGLFLKRGNSMKTGRGAFCCRKLVENKQMPCCMLLLSL